MKNNELLHVLHCGIDIGEKYPASVRQFCFSLHYHSPRAYTFIRETFKNTLPHPRTISSWYANSDARGEPGLQKEHMEKLKKISHEFKDKHGHGLLCSLVFDEMSIRKQVQWSMEELKYIGYVSQGDENNETKTIASQVVVFLLNGINACLEFPVSYYFISSLDDKGREKLLKEVIIAVTECDIKISNITFDGHPANIPMCKLLGANLDPCSKTFRPYFSNPVNNENIHIMLDPCHMEKLVRNTLANKKVIYDDQNNKVEWRYFESLHKYSKENNMRTHKLNKRHIEWNRIAMNVRIAVETFSESVANSMEFLLQQNHPDFIGSAATIRFVRYMDILFNIFNSKHKHNENVFKRPISPENQRIIFDHFETITAYFKSLHIDVDNFKKKTNKSCVRTTTRIPLLKSKNLTAFRGFIIDMHSVRMMYKEYIENSHLMSVLPTYHLLQDVLEIFFGKIRACGGFNNNPNMYQFKGAYRKLLANIKVLISEFANCRLFDSTLPSNLFFSNIYLISSKRAKISFDDFDEVYEEQKNDILDMVGDLDDSNIGHILLDSSSDFSIAYLASSIEKKIEGCSGFYCNGCRNVFNEDRKVEAYNSDVLRRSPCVSTFTICKITEKFFKLLDVRDSKKHFDFRSIYCLIFRSMDLNSLFPNSKFECDVMHRYHFIKCIIGAYISKRATDVSKEITFNQHDKLLRQQWNHLILFKGQ